jgi:hypothetical protein
VDYIYTLMTQPEAAVSASPLSPYERRQHPRPEHKSDAASCETRGELPVIFDGHPEGVFSLGNFLRFFEITPSSTNEDPRKSRPSVELLLRNCNDRWHFIYFS